MAKQVHDDGWARIERVGEGFVLTIRGNDRNTVLIIKQDGAMVDPTGEAIDVGDREAARQMLPYIGAAHVVTQLRQGIMDQIMKAILTRWQHNVQPE